MVQKNDLFDYSNRVIYQDTESFKFSLDSILLAEFSNKIVKASKVVDLCAGNMAVPLILSTYSECHYVGFEINRDIYDLGLKSINENRLNKSMEIINDNVINISNYYPNNYFDVVVCNPPYFKVNKESILNNNEAKRIARHEIFITLEDIFCISRNILSEKGRLYLVHRSSRLDEIINYSIKYGIGVKKIQLVSTKAGEKPTLVLVECVKNSKRGVIINPEICIDGVKSYQNIFKEK